MKESKIELTRRLFTEYGLVEEDVFSRQLGGRKIVTITRTGIDKIQAKAGITITYRVEYLDLADSMAAIRATGTREGFPPVETFGTATPKNNSNAHVLEMAEKRARARAVLMLAGFYAQGIFGEGENIQDDGE